MRISSEQLENSAKVWLWSFQYSISEILWSCHLHSLPKYDMFCNPSFFQISVHSLIVGRKQNGLISNNLEHGVSNECRDRSRNICRGNKGHDGNHGQTPVVQFSTLLDFHLFGIAGGEVDWRENNGRHRSALCVVCSLRFSDNLGEENGEVDLGLACMIVSEFDFEICEK